MIIARPIQYTSDPDSYVELFTALGLVSLEADGDWHVLAALDGRVAVHTVPEGDPLDGRADLGFESDALENLGWEIVATGGIRAVVVPAELPLVVMDETPAEAIGSRLSTIAMWFTPDVVTAGSTLERLGLSPEVASDSGGWVQLRADAGLAAVHGGTEPRAEVTFEYRGYLEHLLPALERFGARIIDETYGRTLLVDRPGGGEPIWINERQTDLYGYAEL